MNVKIKETGKVESLSIIDPKNGVNWINDFIGNYGALSDGQFSWNNEEDVFEADQATYDWWYNVIKAYINADEVYREYLESLEDEYDKDYVIRAVSDACNCDLEDQPAAIIATIEDFKEKQVRGFSPAEIEN
jgi:hypothetical protein